MRITVILSVLFLLMNCQPPMDKVQQNTVYEISLTAKKQYSNAYTDAEVWAEFTNQDGEKFLRPAFWDGGQNWKIRVTPADDHSIWSWKTFASTKDSGLAGHSGKFQSVPYTGKNNLQTHGLLTMSAGHRNVVHSDGTPFLLVGDTPWAIPFRATSSQVEDYAKLRQEQGFNAALLMTVQPDMNAQGPDARNTDQGFARGFDDLSEGNINQLNVSYFQYLDSLLTILLDHEIVPVLQPVFHGFGWKGLKVLGNTVDVQEYVRYCKYLLARYGAQPAFYLVSGDSNGLDPGVGEAGEMLEKWDAYHQPTGIHYNPCGDYVAAWATPERNPCLHYDSTFQSAAWLDFQWTQTGHSGEHRYSNVERMYNYHPTKAVANGEPTYEGMGGGRFGLGWWQGEEAWNQFLHGGTMGVVYGAASLWQWKITADEKGWGSWAAQPMSWHEAMLQEGANYVGYLSKALQGVDISDIEKHPELASNNLLLAKPGVLYITYLPEGGSVTISEVPEKLKASWFNPKTGEFAVVDEAITSNNIEAPGEAPWVLIIK